MKAAFVKKCRKVKIEDIPVPEVRQGEILVKMEACGVCGSDFIEAELWATDWKRFGHEIAATVAEVGPEATGFKKGDQVAIALSAPCGSCPPCLAGVPRKCRRLVTAEQGGFAEFLRVKDVRLLHKVDPPLPTNLAVFAEPLTVILDAFEVASVKSGDHILVVGGGFIGMLSLLAAKAVGAHVAGVLTRRTSADLTACLRSVGAESYFWRTLFGRTIGCPASLRERLAGITGRLIVVHTAPACYIGLYVKALPYDTAVVNMGLSARTRENKLGIDFSQMIFNRCRLLSAFPVPCLHMPEAVSMLRRHADLFAIIEPERRRLEDLPEVIGRSAKRGRKIVIVP